MPTRPYSKVSAWKNISSREFESQSDPIQKFTKSLISMLKNTYRNLLQVPEDLKKQEICGNRIKAEFFNVIIRHSCT